MKKRAEKDTVKKKYVETPLMKQYYSIKHKHPDAILLFRVGDFYETFGEDAITASKILGITLTQRANGAASFVELAGFPHHSVDTYLPKLVMAGMRVAICEQLEDPKTTKKIVKRGVTELITPGVATNNNILKQRENNFLASVQFGKKEVGIAFLDISTGEFYTTQGEAVYIDKLINSFAPKEVLYSRGCERKFEDTFGSQLYTYKLDDWAYNESGSIDRLKRQFSTTSLKGFGVAEIKEGVIAAGAILSYLDLTHNHKVDQISKLVRIENDKYVWMDRFTSRNLELFSPMNEGGETVVSTLDRCTTPMGSRLLRRWLSLPLKDKVEIDARLSVVETFTKEIEVKDTLEDLIYQIGDLERIISRVATGKVVPRELISLRGGLEALTPIKEILNSSSNKRLVELSLKIDTCAHAIGLISKTVMDSPPVNLNKGGVIADGFSEELDDLRKISSSGKGFLESIRERESAATGIPSLKIGFNNVFGYYIEIRNTHKDKVPEEWIRKQTLVSAERYITEELKEYETKILGAEEKILSLEISIYSALISELIKDIESIQQNAAIVAEVDTLISFANVSIVNRYVKPEINSGYAIEIEGGRHPVIENQLPIGEEYISNDIELNCDSQQIIIVTGPNMAGKSALLRQTALITLFAQIGCFVSADKCSLGYVDKIFTRVGASDNISQGESTFMVEMNEASTILNNISERSLILFDELGRGTSTYDGISIAWSIVEYLHEHPTSKAKTLFATHYHELNEMEGLFNRVKNYNVSIQEIDNRVIFLRKLVRGGSNHSFGIHVAKMAGMPQTIIDRANDILLQLESERSNSNREERELNSKSPSIESVPTPKVAESEAGYQLSMFQLDDPTLTDIKNELKNLDINHLTPIEALNKLSEIKRKIGL